MVMLTTRGPVHSDIARPHNVNQILCLRRPKPDGTTTSACVPSPLPVYTWSSMGAKLNTRGTFQLAVVYTIEDGPKDSWEMALNAVPARPL